MRTAVEIVNEFSEASKERRAMEDLPIKDCILASAIAELHQQITDLQQTKQDKPVHADDSVSPGDLSKGSLQGRLHRLLSTAGAKEPEVASKIHKFFRTLE